MSFDVETLYALMPAVYRIRDIKLAEQIAGQVPESARGPLKALLALVAEHATVVGDNIDQLYDDLFIETCAKWVVPYIGDLIGARGVTALTGARFTERAFVANTMAYRRRKGTASVLEQLARDVTGWNASAVEYFERLATTQYLNHLRVPIVHRAAALPAGTAFASSRGGAGGNLSFADIGNAAALEAIGTPFDRIARTADVRRIEPRRGRYNIPNVGIFIYRLWNYTVTDAPAFQLDPQRYLFDALGKDTALYNTPETEVEITHLAEPANVPQPLTRRVLNREKMAYYGIGKSLSIALNGVDVPAASVEICDLSDAGAGWAHTPAANIAIDPALGRIALPAAGSPLTSVRVTYSYGFSDDIGGGEYERTSSFVGADPPVQVTAANMQVGLNQIAAAGGVVEVTDNDYFAGPLSIVAGTTAGRAVELRAASQRRPIVVLASDLTIIGGDESEVTINGLLITGRIRIPAVDGSGNPNKLRLLRLRDCTLAPGARRAMLGFPAEPARPTLVVELANVDIEIDDSIVGGVRAVDTARVRITSSIVDASGPSGVAYADLSGSGPGAPIEIRNATVIGKVSTLVMTLASNTIFLADVTTGDGWAGPVLAMRLQEGCARFSFVPPGSRVPKPFHCQPASACAAARVRPVFTSLQYGEAGYGQLSQHCAREIRLGADDGAEMGAFHDLYQPQRAANVRTGLDEYLRFGLEAGVFFAS
jgi:hypothetical protein